MAWLVSPSQPKTPAAARITLGNDSVSVRLPEKREDFRRLVKSMDYTWSGMAWARNFGSVTGPALDRAAELGRTLLAAGFCVDFPSEQVRDLALSGEYKPETRRWVTTDGDGRFRLRWHRSEDVYRECMRLAGARYNPPGVVVPSDYYNEVLDFARINGFLIHETALALVERAEARRSAGLIVDITSLAEPTPATPQPEPEPESYEIDDSLRDNAL